MKIRVLVSVLWLSAFGIFHSAVAEKEEGADITACAVLADLAVEEGKLPPRTRAVVTAMTDAGFALHRSLAEPNKNITTSPFSLFSALGLLENGAENGSPANTKEEIDKTMYLGSLSRDDLNAGYHDLSERVLPRNSENTLAWGNAVFTDHQFPVNPQYRERIKAAFQAHAESLPFSDPNSLKVINKYFEDQTKGLLPPAFDSLPISGAVLGNGGYFKGAWSFKFPLEGDVETEQSGTDENGTFTLADGKTKTMPIMYHQNRTFPYLEGKGFRMASVSFKGGDFVMDMIVPEAKAGESPGEALRRVQSEMTAKNYQQWLGQMSPKELTVLGLPRFETESNLDLIPGLTPTMPSAFGQSANFSGLSTTQSKITKGVHMTKLKFDESGAEGAFFTGFTMESFSLPMGKPAIVADRPFIAVIRNPRTNAVIFVTTQYNPTALPRPQ